MGNSAKKGGRKLSAFNIFMKQELKRIKSAHQGMDHKKAFKMAAQNWSSKKSTFKVDKQTKSSSKKSRRKTRRKSRKSKK
jgi:hypothetical protein